MSLKRAARRLRKDVHLREDLAQEMSLSVLECRHPHSLSFFLSRATCRAINYIKRWERGKKRTGYIHDHMDELIYDPIEREERREAAIAELKRQGMGFVLDELAIIEAEFAAHARAAA